MTMKGYRFKNQAGQGRIDREEVIASRIQAAVQEAEALQKAAKAAKRKP